MKITGTGKVYKNQYGWSISDNQKQSDGSYNNFYIPIYFAKTLEEPNDRDYISINGFTKPFKYQNGKLGMSYVIVDYTVINNNSESNEAKKDQKQEISNDIATSIDPFEQFGQEVIIRDEDLPF